MSTDKAQKYYAEKNKDLQLQRQIDPLATTSFILSLAPLYLIVIPWLNFLLFLSAPLAVVFAAAAILRIRKNQQLKGMGFAFAGMIIGIFTTLLLLLGLIVLGTKIFTLFA